MQDSYTLAPKRTRVARIRSSLLLSLLSAVKSYTKTLIFDLHEITVPSTHYHFSAAVNNYAAFETRCLAQQAPASQEEIDRLLALQPPQIENLGPPA